MKDESTSNSTGHDAPDQGRIVVVAVLFEGGLAPLALLIGWLLGHSPLEGFRWSIRDAALGLVAALPMFAAFRFVMRRPFGPFKQIKRFFDEELAPILGSRPDSDFALISIAAGVGEELLFRGVLQALVARWLGTWEGLAVASLVFGLLHPLSAAYILMAGLLGAYLGVLWILSGNLLVVMIAHAFYDYLALRDLFRDREP